MVFVPFEAVNGIPPNDIVSSDQIDDVLMMFDEMDIDAMEDDLGALKMEEEKLLRDEEDAAEFRMEAFERRRIRCECISVRWERFPF